LHFLFDAHTHTHKESFIIDKSTASLLHRSLHLPWDPMTAWSCGQQLNILWVYVHVHTHMQTYM